LIKQQGAFHEDQALNLMIQACAGVGYAHRAGVVHCDIKPHNLIVTPDQQLKVTDFGISRALASIHPEEQSDVVWGSPQYFSPEQSAGGAPSPASDVYSLGVVMYEMLTGRLPFVADSSEELARLHQQSNPVPPHLINAEVSPELDHIVLKVMAKEPAMRYRTADQLGRILENYQAHPQAKHTATTNGSETALPETRVNQAVPVNNPPPAAYRPSPLPQKPASSSNPIEIDWVLIILGLLTVIAVGGLIPFWLWVFFSFNPLIP
jgi:serine/threonine protein kinase